MYVVAGLTERAGSRIYNAAVLIDPRGQLLLKHRKINLLDIEQGLYSTGDRLAVAETACGVIGVNICADNFPDSLCWATRWPAWEPKSSSRPPPGQYRPTTIRSPSPTVPSGKSLTAAWQACTRCRWWESATWAGLPAGPGPGGSASAAPWRGG